MKKLMAVMILAVAASTALMTSAALPAFTYQGVILDPVVGWTTHHSIVEYKGEWFLFYHDCVPSNDITHLRSLKVQRLFYNEDGTIQKVINE